MPNQPKTPVRSIRIEDELWDATRDAATKEGTTTTAVVRKALSAYVRTASAVACALVALVLLSGCGGSSQAAADTYRAVSTGTPAVAQTTSNPTAAHAIGARVSVSVPVGGGQMKITVQDLGTDGYGIDLQSAVAVVVSPADFVGTASDGTLVVPRANGSFTGPSGSGVAGGILTFPRPVEQMTYGATTWVLP